MALKNPTTGEYLKITGIALSDDSVTQINYKIYQSVEHRLAGDSEYLHASNSMVNSGLLAEAFNRQADGTDSIANNFKKAGYEAIKSDKFTFSTWEDA